MVDKHVESRQTWDKLYITDGEVIQWFNSLTTAEQNEWVQDVTGRETVAVEGFSIRTNGCVEMDIEYTYLVRQ